MTCSNSIPASLWLLPRLDSNCQIPRLFEAALRTHKAAKRVKIRSHHESHVVELANGSRWKIFPGDLDLTLHWKPETELRVEPFNNGITVARTSW